MWLPEDSEYAKVTVDGREVLSYMKCRQCAALILNNYQDRQIHALFHVDIARNRPI